MNEKSAPLHMYSLMARKYGVLCVMLVSMYADIDEYLRAHLTKVT